MSELKPNILVFPKCLLNYDGASVLLCFSGNFDTKKGEGLGGGAWRKLCSVFEKQQSK